MPRAFLQKNNISICDKSHLRSQKTYVGVFRLVKTNANGYLCITTSIIPTLLRNHISLIEINVYSKPIATIAFIIDA